MPCHALNAILGYDFHLHFKVLTNLFFGHLSLPVSRISATGKPPWPEFTNNLAALFHVATSTVPPPTPPGLSPQCAAFLSR